MSNDTNIPTAAESERLDALTAYCSTILGHVSGERLDNVLGGEFKRRGRNDAEYRRSALENTHPDDLVAAIAAAGLSLAAVGIESIQLAIKEV